MTIAAWRATLDVANCHNDDCRASGDVALLPHALTTGAGLCFTVPAALKAGRGATAADAVEPGILRAWAVQPRCTEQHTVAEAPPVSLEVAVVAPVPVVDVDAFYRALLDELGLLAQRGGSAVGAAAVAKRVALAHGVGVAADLPVPRLTRAELIAFARVGVSRERARQAVPRGR